MSPVREHLSFATLRKALLETSLLPFPGLPPFASPSQTAPAWHTLPQSSWLLQINIYISWVFCFSSGKLALNVIDFFFFFVMGLSEAKLRIRKAKAGGREL